MEEKEKKGLKIIKEVIPYVIVIGEDEISKNIFKLKDMKTGEEKEISIDDINSLKL